MYTFAPRHLHLCGVSSATDTHGLMVERRALKLLSEGSDNKLPLVKGEKHTRETLNVPQHLRHVVSDTLFSKKSSVF